MTEFDLDLGRCARFYGWNHQAMMEMPMRVFQKYCLMIVNLRAEEKMQDAEIIGLTKFKKEKRRQIWNRLIRQTKQFVFKERTQSPQQIAEQIARMMSRG